MLQHWNLAERHCGYAGALFRAEKIAHQKSRIETSIVTAAAPAIGSAFS
jgi:hypothetical protein